MSKQIFFAMENDTNMNKLFCAIIFQLQQWILCTKQNYSSIKMFHVLSSAQTNYEHNQMHNSKNFKIGKVINEQC